MANLFDFLVIILAIGTGILGFRDGFIRQAVKLAGFLLTLVLMARFADSLLAIARTLDPVPSWIAVLLVFGGVLILSVLAFHLLASVLAGMVAITPVQFVDAGLGGAFGMLKALIFCGFLAAVLAGAPERTFFNDQYRGSVSAEPLGRMATAVVPVLKSAAARLFQYRTDGQYREERNEHVTPTTDL